MAKQKTQTKEPPKLVHTDTAEKILVVREKLNALRSSADWDSSMLSWMNLMERQIAWAENNDEQFYRLPKVVELVGILNAKVDHINHELGNNRDLTTAQRQLLFLQRDVTEMELSTFSYGGMLEGIEKQIDFEADALRHEDPDLE